MCPQIFAPVYLQRDVRQTYLRSGNDVCMRGG